MGLVLGGSAHYLPPMSILPRPSGPRAVIEDLKGFWASAPKHKVTFALASVAIPTFLIAMFLLSSRDEIYKPPTIIYVDNWRADRTEAQIKAQQKIDTARRKQMEAQIAKAEAEKRAYFKSVQDNMKSWGF